VGRGRTRGTFSFDLNKRGRPVAQALIFDCDGTLADTMPAHWRAWQVVTSRYNLSFSSERFYATGGIPTRIILATLSQEQGIPIDPVRVAEEKEAEYLRHIDGVKPVQPIVDIARAHHGLVPLAVASGGSRAVTHETLNRLGLFSLFGAIVTHEDVARQKPAPDIYLEAARRLGVAPLACRAYEDTDIGIEAIRAAGMEAVDVRALLKSSPL